MIVVRLWPSLAKLPHWLRQRTINQIRQGETCRPIGSQRFCRRKLNKYEQVMPKAKQQRLCTRYKPRVIFTIRDSRSIVLIVVTEIMYI